MPRMLIMTTVHDPDDARVRHRILPTLQSAAIRITYAAPFAAFGRLPPQGVRALDLPRSAGRRRLGALLAARRLLRCEAADHDLILVHDPELVLAVLLPGCRRARGTVVWDVQEDTAAALSMRSWVPTGTRWALSLLIRSLEGWAERQLTLILAEPAYQQRFRIPHQVIRNCVPVAPVTPGPLVTPGPPAAPVAPVTPAAPGSTPVRPRVVYLGRLTRARGTGELLELGRTLSGRIDLELIGPADQDVVAPLRSAVTAGWVRWWGTLGNPEALHRLPGALAGLCLLHDQPNYRHSVPMKMLEYMAAGLPVVTTPNPGSAGLIRRAGCGAVVPFGSTEQARRVLLDWADDPETAHRLGAAGRRLIRAEYDWEREGRDLVAFVRARAGRAG